MRTSLIIQTTDDRRLTIEVTKGGEVSVQVRDEITDSPTFGKTFTAFLSKEESSLLSNFIKSTHP